MPNTIRDEVEEQVKHQERLLARALEVRARQDYKAIFDELYRLAKILMMMDKEQNGVVQR
jgi:hypothetical protein